MSDYSAVMFAALMIGLMMTTAAFAMRCPSCNTLPHER
jgi:hypothetical protein